MKIRYGFVSNSSSSSFVIALDKKPTSAIQIQLLLFDANQTRYSGFYDKEGYGVAEVSEYVLSQLCDQEPMGFDEVVELMAQGHISSISRVIERELPKLPWKASEKARTERWKQRDIRHKELAADFARKFITLNPLVDGKQLYKLEFSDDTSFGSTLEHGDLLHKVPHIRISHH